ncbi:MAG: alpha/beta hydrolase [Rhodobacteraceae bacterium]|nr:alpha/beta hydrolase [Paracoccaceae bacterium]MBL4810902.1 alpha/beta hydrolase [Paracoccaceae bacterium]
MLNPELEPFLKTWDAGWADLKPNATPADRRAHFEVIAKNMRLETPADIECNTEHWVDSPAGKVRVRVFRHISGGAQPCLIYMHGGAWMQGSPETHWDITSRIAAWNKQTVISVDYALTPENPFPAAIDQCTSVAHWVHTNAAELGVNQDRISVGGDSAGGNLAAAMTLDLRETEVPIIAQALFYPACDFDNTRQSYIDNANAPLLQTKGMDRVNAMYCPDTSLLASNPRVAPLVADTHAGLPPAYIAVAQYDPLRDSGVAYADALKAAGIPVELTQGAGLIHGYLRAMDTCTDSMASLRAMCDWLAEVG